MCVCVCVCVCVVPPRGVVCTSVLPCRLTPNKPCTLEALRALGVLYWGKVDADHHETDARLAAIRKTRNYSFMVGAGTHAQAHKHS